MANSSQSIPVTSLMDTQVPETNDMNATDVTT